jgi:hypothetical protein
MKTLIYCATATAALALIALPTLAQDRATVLPNKLTVEALQRPPLQLDDRQKSAIRAAVDGEDTAQKAPQDFQAADGGAVPKDLTVHAMPLALLERVPSLKQYGYAKLADQILVIDPMKRTIIAILPGATGGESTSGSGGPMEPAGDSGDKSNGTAGSTRKK